MAYNSFPYVSMHELNLDYLLNKSKEVQANVEASAGSASAAASSAAAAANSAEASLTYSRNSANSAAASESSAADSAESARIAAASAGDPKTFTASAQLTDTNKIYVYIGETGTYTYGHWYYYAGGAWIDGGVYGTWATDAALNPDSTNAVQNKVIYNTFSELRGELSNHLNTANISASGLSSVYLHTGQKMHVHVNNIDGNANIYIDGHTQSGVTLINADTLKHDIIYTSLFDGYVRIALLTATVIDIDVYISSEVRDAVNNNSIDIEQLKSSILTSGNLPVEIGSINTASGQDYDSTTQLRSVGLIPTFASKLSFQKSTARLFAYTKTGTYVGGWTGSEWSVDYRQIAWISSPIIFANFPAEYDYRVGFRVSTGETVSPETVAASIDVNRVSKMETEYVTTYEVGAGKQFLTFTEMLTTLENNDKPKIVYVYPGEYDIFEEIGGAAYIQSLDITGLNWRDVSKVVPPNTEIIGLGKVILKWKPTDAQIIDNEHAFLFSPLNLSGSCKIRNITVVCNNCRYGIHDETSGRSDYNKVERELDNVKVYYSHSTYGTQYAYGAGHNKNGKYTYKNCVFSTYYSTSYSIHDWPAGIDEKTSFLFDNCVIWNSNSNEPGTIRFSSSDNVGRLDDVKINGCVFGAITFSTEGTSDVRQGYDVNTMLCKPYTVNYSSHIINDSRVAPTDYLVIA